MAVMADPAMGSLVDWFGDVVSDAGDWAKGAVVDVGAQVGQYGGGLVGGIVGTFVAGPAGTVAGAAAGAAGGRMLGEAAANALAEKAGEVAADAYRDITQGAAAAVAPAGTSLGLSPQGMRMLQSVMSTQRAAAVNTATGGALTQRTQATQVLAAQRPANTNYMAAQAVRPATATQATRGVSTAGVVGTAAAAGAALWALRLARFI